MPDAVQRLLHLADVNVADAADGDLVVHRRQTDMQRLD